MLQDNTNIFLKLYNELDDALRIRLNEPNRSISVFVRIIDKLNSTNNLKLKEYARKLNMIRILRNNLIHEFDMNHQRLFIISDETIAFLKEAIDFFQNPRLAKNVMTPIDKLLFVYNDENIDIHPLMIKMKNKGFSQIPVLTKEKNIEGIFSPNVLFDYISHNSNVNIENLKLKDLNQYLYIDKHFSERYNFVSKNLSEESCINVFTEAFEKNIKLRMLLVTNSGKSDEPLLGIIVPTDLFIN